MFNAVVSLIVVQYIPCANIEHVCESIAQCENEV